MSSYAITKLPHSSTRCPHPLLPLLSSLKAMTRKPSSAWWREATCGRDSLFGEQTRAPTRLAASPSTAAQLTCEVRLLSAVGLSETSQDIQKHPWLPPIHANSVPLHLPVTSEVSRYCWSLTQRQCLSRLRTTGLNQYGVAQSVYFLKFLKYLIILNKPTLKTKLWNN